MRFKRGAPRLKEALSTIPFDSAEEAWFWFARCQKLRLMGARFEASSSLEARPCDPDDLYRTAVSLNESGRLQGDHLTVLGTFGVAERPPDPRCTEEELMAKLWDEALDAMTTVLKQKGIVQ